MSRFWDHHATTIDLANFRANNQFLWQPDHYPYEEILNYLVVRDESERLVEMGEDGSFGVRTWDVDGFTVSRDLLDSALEINFLERHLPRFGVRRVLDIGAGYGRLAHRLLQTHPELDVTCTDTVEVSLKCCRLYRDHCALPWNIVARNAMHMVDLARNIAADLAINIQSWSECTRVEVDRWVSQLAYAMVPWLFVIPHEPGFTTKDAYDAGTTQRDGNAPPEEFRSVIEGHGYTVHRQELAADTVDGRNYYLFRRER